MTPAEISSAGIYSIDELTDILGIAERHIAAELNHGALDGRKLGKKWFVTGRSLLEYLEPQKHPASIKLHSERNEPPASQHQTESRQSELLHPEHSELQSERTESPAAPPAPPAADTDTERLQAVLAAVAETESNARAAERLNERGIATARGGAWTSDAVRKARITAEKRGITVESN